MKRLFLVLLLCSPASAQVQQWNLQDNAASTTVVAAVGTNATLVGGDNTSAKSSTGPGGSYALAFDLNGTDDGVDMSASALSYTSGQAWSISIWADFDASSGPLIGRTTQNPGIVKSSDTVIQVRDGSANTLSFTVPSMGTTSWHHFLITKTTGNSTRVFMDGAESSSGAQTLPATFAPQAIGYRNGVFMDGKVSGVKVFADDQSANVAALYAEGFSSGGPIPRVVNYYHRTRNQ
jgi:hypothetical protein